MTLGEKLKELRGNKSQAWVANKLGISKSAVSMHERDERIPRDDVKKKYASLYKKSVAFIFYA